jgi:adenosylhomocysteine nucleosidase
MTGRPLRIVCFAVKEEARFFKPPPNSNVETRTVVTGMGASNAEKAIRKLLANEKPALVLSCGFAGALKPELATGAIVFSVDPETNLEPALLSSGAIPALFHCAQKVATTAAQKRTLRQTTRADVVEMESDIICEICRASRIPSGTIRVILDTANEDLPLDFNALMTEEQRLSFSRLALALLKAPWKIPALLRLQNQTAAAARRLAFLLEQVL